MKAEKAFLREKFVEFQRKVAELGHVVREQERTFLDREKTLFLDIFEVLDAFENLDENMKAKEGTFDKSTRKLAKSIRSIHRKLLRTLGNHHVVRMEFPDSKAEMECCKVLETQAEPDMADGAILSVVKNGYMNTERGEILRKAEVVTVLNEE